MGVSGVIVQWEASIGWYCRPIRSQYCVKATWRGTRGRRGSRTGTGPLSAPWPAAGCAGSSPAPITDQYQVVSTNHSSVLCQLTNESSLTVWKTSTTPSYCIRSSTIDSEMNTPVLPTPALQTNIFKEPIKYSKDKYFSE